MPSLQKEVLKAKLMRDFRYGIIARCHLSGHAYRELLSLKEQTRRTYQDIIRIAIDVYDRYRFPTDPSKGRIIIAFRLNKQTALTAETWAWGYGVYRSRFIGGILEGFFSRIPKAEIRKILISRADQAVRLIKEAVRG